jgi:hypothetical protein
MAPEEAAMNPVLRIWAIFATLLAVMLALRGAWPLALACFLLSPAPAWAFAHSGAARADATASWLRVIAIGAGAIAVLYVLAIAMGGIPPVHEWRRR